MQKTISSVLIFLLPFWTSAQPGEAVLLGTWSDDRIPASDNHQNPYNEIWGFSAGGYEYAIIGTTVGTHFIDVTDPHNPQEAHFIAGGAQGSAIVHRDYHDYAGFLFAAAGEGANSSLQVIDMRQLPDTLYTVYEDKAVFNTAHNIFIDTSSARLYVLTARGMENGYAPMRIYDVKNPMQPLLLGSFFEFGGIQPSHVHDAFVRDNIAFLNLGNEGLVIVDFSDIERPLTLSSVKEYPFRGYNHSGWLSSDFSTYYFADENHGFDMKVLNVEDLCEPEVKGTFNALVSNPQSIPHNQVVACNYLYVSYYYDGLRVYDLEHSEAPELVLYYDTYPEADGNLYRGAWGVYPFLPSGNILVSDMQSGLFVFEGVGDNCSEQRGVSKTLSSQNCRLTDVRHWTSEVAVQTYPNPVGDRIFLSLDLPLALEELNIFLFDSAGQQLQSWKKNHLSSGKNDFTFLWSNSLPTGLYFISLEGEYVRTTKKLVIGGND